MQPYSRIPLYNRKAAPANIPPTILTPAVIWAAAPVKLLGCVIVVLALALVEPLGPTVMILVLVGGGGMGPVDVGGNTGWVHTSSVHFVVVIMDFEEVVDDAGFVVGAAPQPDSPGYDAFAQSNVVDFAEVVVVDLGGAPQPDSPGNEAFAQSLGTN